MRIKKATNEMNLWRALAVEKTIKKEKCGAVAALRKTKLYEKKIMMLDELSIMLEMQVEGLMWMEDD